MNGLFMRIAKKYRRYVMKRLYCRTVTLKTDRPIISFSFDDAPRTAFNHGSEILNAHGAWATFYVSLGILDSDSPSGVLASKSNLRRALEEGHELGCHTFDHKNAWETKPDIFVQSVLRNRQALNDLFPSSAFLSLAYPISGPRPETKRRVGKLFRCCRWGCQTYNVGSIDLNLLKAFFLDARSGATTEGVKQLIDQNSNERGWLIFATHDIDDNPSSYGCSTKFFKEVVQYAATSGSLLLPVGKACEHIQIKGT